MSFASHQSALWVRSSGGCFFVERIDDLARGDESPLGANVRIKNSDGKGGWDESESSAPAQGPFPLPHVHGACTRAWLWWVCMCLVCALLLTLYGLFIYRDVGCTLSIPGTRQALRAHRKKIPLCPSFFSHYTLFALLSLVPCML